MQKHTREIILTNTLTVFNAVNAVIIGILYAAFRHTNDGRLLWDGLGVAISSIINTVMSIVQEYRAHAALEKISVLAELPANVLRSGVFRPVASRELGPGDVVRVVRGDVVPADGVVIEAVACELDTSMLTGESEPQSASPGTAVSGGSICLSGQVDIELIAYREHSLSGRIESHAQKLDLAPSPLQQRVNAIFVWSFVFAGVFAGIDLLGNPQAMLQDVTAIRRAATLVLGLIPESLILLSTITFIVGTIRIRKLGIIVQRLAALESFAQATDVCFDKTGTLTTNDLVIDKILPIGATSYTDAQQALSDICSSLADESQTIRAIRQHIPSSPPRKVDTQVSFSSATKYSALRLTGDNATYILGAADVVCTTEHPQWSTMHDVLSASGRTHKRSILLARSSYSQDLCGPHTDPICWVTFDDTLRSDARSTIAMFHNMHIATHVLTGDKLDTAAAVVDQLGINSSAIAIHARCTPEDKYRIVDELCENGHVIMIGDGINDIPALRRADVGIAPSQSSSATKLVADIVLEKGGFADFPAMIDEGRTAVRTVFSVAMMFLTKNVLLVAITFASWFTTIPFVLSPRRGALLSIIGIVIPSLFVSWLPQRGIATIKFFRELIVNVVISSTAALASYAVVLQLNHEHIHVDILAVYSLLASLLTVFVLHASKHRATYGIVSSVTLALVAALMILPTTMPIINLIQLFYEIGNAGIQMVGPLVVTALASIAISALTITVLRWLVLPRLQR